MNLFPIPPSGIGIFPLTSPNQERNMTKQLALKAAILGAALALSYTHLILLFVHY